MKPKDTYDPDQVLDAKYGIVRDDERTAEAAFHEYANSVLKKMDVIPNTGPVFEAGFKYGIEHERKVSERYKGALEEISKSRSEYRSRKIATEALKKGGGNE